MSERDSGQRQVHGQGWGSFQAARGRPAKREKQAYLLDGGDLFRGVELLDVDLKLPVEARRASGRGRSARGDAVGHSLGDGRGGCRQQQSDSLELHCDCCFLVCLTL